MDEWQIGDSRFRRVPGSNRTWLERVLLWAALPLVLTFFFAGCWWQSDALSKADAGIDKLADSPARRAALDAIDEAVCAKFEKRMTGVLAALDRARRIDPTVPGLDIFFAEAALDERQFSDMRVAAGAAKKKGDHVAGAELLLGMDKWLNRGSSDREMSAAADDAAAYFRSSTEAEPFFAMVWFFWGDVSRYAGREGEGRRRALGALHRFNPWDSSDVIVAKAILASAAAGDAASRGLSFLVDSEWARAVAQVGTSHSADPAAWNLAPFASQATLRSLFADQLAGISVEGASTRRTSVHGVSGLPLLP